MKSLFIIAILFTNAAFAQLTGNVVSIADGDTFTLLTSENEQIRIRLHGIDCPEKKQDFGAKAKQFLSDMIFQKSVNVREMDVDRYGRTIGMVTIDGINVNEALLKAGLAWHYKKYDQNPTWARLDEEASQAKRGLWSQPSSIAPWEYRTAKKRQ
ncbi:thermonuclease family protein [Parachryseolinea silvisoli]|uniref:thermonuclease family protein n=1 Tax=Parachryseolinea silvisoli TaxID=2873601 RepID=UPI002265A827|nr:thermonuclease family protein [Parachryseolinea silvisoli]MCD9015200.1 thermonuclease family protein [Parachryseolinea silvisoli]